MGLSHPFVYDNECFLHSFGNQFWIIYYSPKKLDDLSVYQNNSSLDFFHRYWYKFAHCLLFKGSVYLQQMENISKVHKKRFSFGYCYFDSFCICNIFRDKFRAIVFHAPAFQHKYFNEQF